MSSRFTDKDAADMARRSGLTGKGRALLPVLRAAEAAHDNALAAQKQAEAQSLEMRKRWTELAAKQKPFVAAMSGAAKAWHAMDDDARQSIAWVAAFGANGGDSVRAWLAEALHSPSPRANSPHVNYAAVEARVLHLLQLPIALATETEPYKRKTRMKQLAGLEAANSVFAAQWLKATGQDWGPKYDRATTTKDVFDGKRAVTGSSTAAKIFLCFAQRVGRYTVENCYSASGGQGQGLSVAEYKKRRTARAI